MMLRKFTINNGGLMSDNGILVLSTGLLLLLLLLLVEISWAYHLSNSSPCGTRSIMIKS